MQQPLEQADVAFDVTLDRLDRRGHRQRRGQLIAEPRDGVGQRRQRIGDRLEHLDVALDRCGRAVQRLNRLAQAILAGRELTDTLFDLLLDAGDLIEHRARGVDGEAEHLAIPALSCPA
jgi:hypothetical protein